MKKQLIALITLSLLLTVIAACSTSQSPAPPTDSAPDPTPSILPTTTPPQLPSPEPSPEPTSKPSDAPRRFMEDFLNRDFDNTAKKMFMFKQYAVDDTLEAEYIAYKILCTYSNRAGNIFGTFDSIQDVPVNILVRQALTVVPWVDELSLTENDPVRAAIKKAESEGLGLGHMCYANEIEEALVFLYGDYPVAGETYCDNFDPRFYDSATFTEITYWPDENIFMAHWDSGTGASVPQLLTLDITNDAVVCDVIQAGFYDYPDQPEHHFVNHYVDSKYVSSVLTEENFEEETADLQVLRYTFHFAPDDGRMILYSIEEIREGIALP